ncbi:MAG: sulfotransferase [Pseudomonadota bacterium]
MDDPYALIALIGLPRSGTTLTARMIAAHSKVDGIVEPYHVRRGDNYREDDVHALAQSFDITPKPARAIFVKETTTRVANVDATLDLLHKARQQGVPTGLIVLLRSPFECYLSQVEASQKMWKQKSMTSISDETFARFARASLDGMQQIARRGRGHRLRFVSYPALCADPTNELSRLMGIFPMRFEPTQIALEPTKSAGGDPKAYAKQRIELSDRSADVEALLDDLSPGPDVAKMRKLGRLGRELATLTDAGAVDRLTDIVLPAR